MNDIRHPRRLFERPEPAKNFFLIRVSGKSIAFRDLVMQAYMNRINLGERGFYATPGVDYNRETGKGTQFTFYIP